MSDEAAEIIAIPAILFIGGGILAIALWAFIWDIHFLTGAIAFFIIGIILMWFAIQLAEHDKN